MRKLSEEFMFQLRNGFLAELTRRVVEDYDLDLEIRENYINIYFKGNSLLKLSEISPDRYGIITHDKFSDGRKYPDLVDKYTTQQLLEQIPQIKEKIIRHGKSSLEIEYEQMIIRANNYEPRNNSEYFIIDRQYTASKIGRFDLTGFYWSHNKRRKGQEVPLCLMEIKFALNPEIQKIHAQIERYYYAVIDHASDMALEAQTILRQKLDLGLYKQSKERLDAMKTREISRDFNQFQFIIILVDYNPYSSHYKPENLSDLHFSDQIKVFRSGFAMWNILLNPT